MTLGSMVCVFCWILANYSILRPISARFPTESMLLCTTFQKYISCTAAVTTFSSIIRPTCRYVHSNVSQDVSESCTIYREEDEQERRSCYFQHLQSFQKFFPASDSKKKRKKNSLSLLFNIDGWKLVSLAEWNTERQFRSPSFWVTAETRSERQWQRRSWGKTRF